MFRKLLAVAVFGLSCAAVTFADDAKKPIDEAKPGKGKGGFDRAKAFEKMDADGDGKVTKAEYTKFMEAVMERMKEKGGKGKGGNAADYAAKSFDRMDANKDGVLSKEEFEKGRGMGGRGGFRGKGKGPATPEKE